MPTVHILFEDKQSGRRFVQSFVVKDGYKIRKVIRGARKVIKAKLLMWSVEA